MAEVTVNLERRGAVASLTLNAPPVNALGAPLRSMLAEKLALLADDPTVQAIILFAHGRLFSAGADIREFGKPPIRPALSDMCNQIEAMPKPVIAALHGTALGGGAEVALAAHYRLASPAASLGLPEVTLGLIPGAGGTQRLPRLIGAGPALNMMLHGRPVSAEAADAMGLIDGVVHGDLVATAFAFAQGLVSQGAASRPTGARRDHMRDGLAWLAAVEQARVAHGKAGLLAPRRVIDCVEAALLLPLEAGLAFERAMFEECLADPRSRAIRRLFMAERHATDILDRDDDGRLSLSRAGVALAARLAIAQQTAARALVRVGVASDLIDRSMVDQGFGAGAFGGTDGDAGAQASLIARRINAGVVAEGCRMIAEGALRDAVAVDVLSVYGLGYPRDLGGPMQVAMEDGLLALRAGMAEWATDDPVWSVPQLLTAAVRYADGFDAIPAATSG